MTAEGVTRFVAIQRNAKVVDIVAPYPFRGTSNDDRRWN